MKRQVAETETSRIDLADLRAFCLVVDLGSITGAAKTIGETKGSVSRRLSRLEHALGVDLLRRSPRLVQATEDGVAYRGRVGRILELLDEANTQAQHAQAAPSGHLRVTAPLDLGGAILAPIVAGFSEKYPEVSIELLLTEEFLDFDAHQIDVAVRATASLQDSSLVAHRLEAVEARLFAAPAYLAKSGVPKRPEELAKHRLMLFRATRGSATLTLRKRGEEKRLRLRLHAAISSSDFSFNREAALAGGGIAVLPTLVVRRDVDEGRLVPVLKDYVAFEASIFLVHPGTRFPSPKVRAFRDYVLEAFAVPVRRGRGL